MDGKWVGIASQAAGKWEGRGSGRGGLPIERPDLMQSPVLLTIATGLVNIAGSDPV